MAKLNLKTGTKLTIQLDSQRNNKDFVLKSSFEKSVDEACFLITSPMKDGKAYAIDENDKMRMTYTVADTAFELEGYVDDVVKKGIRNYLKIRVVTGARQFEQRSDARVKAELQVEIIKNYWNADGSKSQAEYPGLTFDVSNGGLAVYTNMPSDTGELVDVSIFRKGVKPLTLRSEICWRRETQKGAAYRNIIGVHFIFDNRTERDRMNRLVCGLEKEIS